MYILPEVEVFTDANFSGGSWRFNMPPNWGWEYVGDDWNDTISSVVIISGRWQFFENANFNNVDGRTEGASVIHGPGYYAFVEDPQFNMQNDTISSILCVSDQPEGDDPVVDM
jgi:Beta/Gamma crystallin